MREVLNNPAFTTDVIVGFPGETEAEFEETLKTCRTAGFMKIHVFPFSTRKGTPAADFPDQVDPKVRKERVRILGELERDLAHQYYRTLVGTELEVLVERESQEKAGWVRGTDRRYAPVELPGSRDDIGNFVTVQGEQAGRHNLLAMRAPVESV